MNNWKRIDDGNDEKAMTLQFKDATLTTERNLDRKIDGISGATLSVNALTKLARLALFLDSYVDNK